MNRNSTCTWQQLFVANTHQLGMLRVLKRKVRGNCTLVRVQGDCAQACHASNTCLACSGPLPAECLHPLSSGKHTKEKARMLGLYDPDTIMATASSGTLLVGIGLLERLSDTCFQLKDLDRFTALSLLAYQEQLMAAKRRTADKAQLKKIVKQSQVKMGELQGAAKKVRWPAYHATRNNQAKCMNSTTMETV